MSPLCARSATVPTEALGLTRQPDPVPHLWLVPVFIWVLNIDSGFQFPLLKGTWAQSTLEATYSSYYHSYVLCPASLCTLLFCTPTLLSQPWPTSQWNPNTPAPRISDLLSLSFLFPPSARPAHASASPPSLPHLSVGTVTITVVLGTCSEPPLHQAVLPQLTRSCMASRPGSRASLRFEG